MHPGIMCGIRFPEGIAGRGNDADAAPVGVSHLHDTLQMKLRAGISAGANHLRVTVLHRRFPRQELGQHGHHRSEQRIGPEARHRGRDSMAIGDERPLFRAHHGRDVAGRDQRVEAGRAGLEQHRDGGPGQPTGQQYEQVVRHTLGEHGCDRRCRGFEACREKHDLTRRVLAGDAHRLHRRGNRSHVPARSASLLERPGLFLGHIDGHAQHVAEGDENNVLVQRELDRFVDVLFGTDADRAAGSRHELDIVRYRRPQSGHGDRAFMPATDVHNADRPIERQAAQFIQPELRVPVHRSPLGLSTRSSCRASQTMPPCRRRSGRTTSRQARDSPARGTLFPRAGDRSRR